VNAFMYSSVLLLLAFMASVGYRPASSTATSGSVSATEVTADIAKPSVDQIAVAGLAAKTAEVANLVVADDASNAAITTAIKGQLAQQSESVITKPQTFEPTSSSAIVIYKAVAGDTVQSVSARYGITVETLKWANNLTTDIIVPGIDMIVPTVDGVVYVVKDGDTVDSLATKYKSDRARIISKNDLEITGLVVGQRIVIPGGVLPENERPGYVAPRRTVISSGVAVAQNNPLYTAQAGNRYTYGTCTWYVYNRRAQIGRPIGSFWGNASSWAYAAASAGYRVTKGNPGVGDIMQNGGGAGHVAFVEEVHDDGSIVVSEMNYYSNGGGWNRISYRSLDAGAASSYTFIK
jgi:surface antigen/phage tail protein X